MDEQTYEINIKRFAQSTEFQLVKLSDCLKRLNEFQGYEDWANVRQAHLNASQIIRRIKTDMKEMGKIRNQIEKLPNTLLVAKVDEQLKGITKRLLVRTDEIETICAPYHKFAPKNSSYMLESSMFGPEMYDFRLEKNEYLAQDKELCNAYDQMQKDCDDLKGIMTAISEEINRQKPTIDSIERNVLSTQDNVQSGAQSLRAAVGYKALGTATSGALIGTLIGGPIGFVAGAKIGAAIGLGSGLVGYFVARRIKAAPDVTQLQVDATTAH